MLTFCAVIKVAVCKCKRSVCENLPTEGIDPMCFSGCTLASILNSWILGDDAESDCQQWHPLLLRLVGQ